MAKADLEYRGVLARGVRQLVVDNFPRLGNGAGFDRFMAQLFEIADSSFAALQKKDPPKRAIACKAGCTYCCHLYVQVTPLEAIAVARAVQQRPAEERARLIARIVETFARVAGKGASQRNALAVPCPLLEDGRCSVYAARPLVCRGANSADVSACETGMGKAEGAPVPTYMHQRYVFAAIGQGAAQGLADAGQHVTLLELVAALKLALEHDDPLAAWRSGKLDFTPARCVEVARAGV